MTNKIFTIREAEMLVELISKMTNKNVVSTIEGLNSLTLCIKEARGLLWDEFHRRMNKL